jgi:hypothetical protein
MDSEMVEKLDHWMDFEKVWILVVAKDIEKDCP